MSSQVQLGKWTALREDIQRFMQTILIGATLAGESFFGGQTVSERTWNNHEHLFNPSQWFIHIYTLRV
jgi:hypothetical protein